jgi:zinc transport system permease protein
MAISVTSGINIDVYNYMFGSILAMSKADVVLSVILSIIVLILYVFFYSKIFAITFDENFAKATGIKAGLYNMLLATLTAVTIVIGMRLMGALLISSLIIFPSLTSMKIFKSFRSVVISSAILSISCFMIGIVISYVFSTPAGASVVCVNIIIFFIFSLSSFLTKIKKYS